MRRDRVHAWVLGEHGDAQVPLWSDVRLLGTSSSGDAERIVDGLRSGPRYPGSEVRRHRDVVFGLLAEELLREAFATVEALPPELRIMLEPFVTAHCLHSTPNATANAALDLLLALGGDRASVVGAQVGLKGELLGLDTVVGVPVLIDALGWSRVECPLLRERSKRG